MSEYPLFEEEVWNYYSKNQRDLPWRKPEADGSFDPYKIWISEIMLQQTQVRRVVSKFQEFITAFPDINALSRASLQEVLQVWSGLGYNRRAKFLLQAAQIIQKDYDGVLPHTIPELVKLPGIGPNTAAAILVYSFNQPEVFIETNIRTVFIHTFFPEEEKVSDHEIRKLVVETLDIDNAREWYWALMDYGSYLKMTSGNASRRSKHYVKQSRFEGSRRQVRAQVLKVLLDGPKSKTELTKRINDERLESVLMDLTSEGFVKTQAKHYCLT